MYWVLSCSQRLALRDSNISRYNAEFHEVCKIGSGSFGTVYKCINRLGMCKFIVSDVAFADITNNEIYNFLCCTLDV